MTAPCPSLGFAVTLDVSPPVGSAGWNDIREAWMEMLESRGLYGRGGGEQRLEYVVASEASQATNNDREEVRRWLSRRADILAWHVGGLEDLKAST